MIIGPDSKKISREIFEINRSLKGSNNTSVGKQIDEKFTKKLSERGTVSTNKTKSFSNSQNTSYSNADLLVKLKDSKTKLQAANEMAFVEVSTKDMNDFFREVLPKMVSISVVYDYNDKFVTDRPFEKWASNFTFTDDIENAYVSYSSADMSSKSVSNKSDYSKYFTSTGMVGAEAFIKQSREDMKQFEADAENVFVVSPNMITEDPNLFEEIAKEELNKTNILSHSKYVFWGSPDRSVLKVGSMAAKKADWKTRGFDDKGLLFTEEGDDVLRGDALADPTKTYAVISPKKDKSLNYIVPDCLKAVEVLTVGSANKGIRLKNDFRGYKTANAESKAYSFVGNLSYDNIGYGSSDDFSDSVSKIDWGVTGKPSEGEGFIGDIIYQLYRNSSEDNPMSTNLGRTTNVLHKHGVSTKSEMDLKTSSSVEFSFGPDTPFATMNIDRRLHVATCIGFTMYTKYGMRTTGYITSSDETIPGATRHSMFAIGRIATMTKRINEGITDEHPYLNGVVQSIIASGPDFMSNMFDAYIVNSNQEKVDMIALTTSPTVLQKIATSNKDRASAETISEKDIQNKLPVTTKKMLESEFDFITRVSSVTIPSFKKELINYSFLNQQYAVPGYKLEHEFFSSLNIELDNNLDYLRLMNYMAGLSNAYDKPNNTDLQYKSIQYRPIRNRAKTNQKISIMVRLRPGNMFYTPNCTSKFILFDDVVFLGGGDVSFSQSSSDLVNVGFKFIYKNIHTFDLGSLAQEYASIKDGNHVDFGIGNTIYAPFIQQNILPDKDTLMATSSIWTNSKTNSEAKEEQKKAKEGEKAKKKQAKEEAKAKKKEERASKKAVSENASDS